MHAYVCHLQPDKDQQGDATAIVARSRSEVGLTKERIFYSLNQRLASIGSRLQGHKDCMCITWCVSRSKLSVLASTAACLCKKATSHQTLHEFYAQQLVWQRQAVFQGRVLQN